MAEFPAIPIWTDAYLGDTTHLTTIEHGAYLLLLFALWRRSDHRLPLDECARVTRLTRRQWDRIRLTLERLPSNHIKDGWWTNSRLLDEVDAVRRYIQQRSDAGKASALKRLHRGSTTVQRNVNENPTPTPTPTPTPNEIANSSLPGSTPLRDVKSVLNGIGMGNGKNGHTIEDPGERLARFHQKIAAHIGPSGWEIIAQASDPQSPEYQSSLIRCKVAAGELGKGWPKQWLKA